MLTKNTYRCFLLANVIQYVKGNRQIYTFKKNQYTGCVKVLLFCFRIKSLNYKYSTKMTVYH